LADQFSVIWPYILAATGAGFIGGIVARFWSPKVKARSAIQHFAAGAVLAAVAANVIPEVARLGNRLGVLAGFTLGGLAMIGLKWWVVKVERKQKQSGQIPAGLIAAAAVDTFLDGIIISAGFSSSQGLGTLLAIALALELFFLTLSVGAELRKGKLKLWQGLGITSGIAVLMLVGALVAGFFLPGVPGSTLAIVLAFGAAALIYLIAEELLVESIQAEESLFSTAMLFSGFLVLLALKLFGEDGS
jgi:ZIP family zinc transporter